MTVRRLFVLAALVGALWSLSAAAAAPALASVRQISIIQDQNALLSDPAGTLRTFRELGVQMVRVSVVWAAIAPAWQARSTPRNFNAGDPAAYPAANWAPYDEIVRLAKADGIQLDMTVGGGAPRWAEGPGIPSAALDNPEWAWRPSAPAFGQFVRAVATRYSGTYVPPGDTTPLPRVSFWAIWNEPNFGEDLGPQAIRGSTVSVAPWMYRNLLAQAWNALQHTGHGRDTILIGETAPRGMSGPARPGHPQGLPGNFAQTRPLQFLRTLYCVDSRFRELRGAAAGVVGCPTNAAGSRAFRRANPALFLASGYADHPYPQNEPPPLEQDSNPDIAPFARLGNLERELDQLQRIYGSRRRLPIWNTEYGYITHPPNSGVYVSPTTAAYYINWAEYLSWKQWRVASTMQYLLSDPAMTPALRRGDGGFASGLEFVNGRHKPAYAAYRLPLYLPVTSARRGAALEVWGCVRPARYAILDTARPQSAQIQFSARGSGVWRVARRLSIFSPDNCYFDVRLRFGSSGSVRLAYSYPFGGATVYSRTVAVTVR
jgi:hypothetical protein